MSILALPRPRLRGSLFTATDYWRRSPAVRGGRAGHKEWSYFCVLGPGLDLLVNFSLVDAPRSTRAHRKPQEVPRLVVLARQEQDQWEGDVEEFVHDRVSAQSGSCDTRFGTNTVAFDGERYRIGLRLANSPIEAELELTPLTPPAIASSVTLSRAGPMRWLVVPRLSASGTIDIAGRRYEIDDCPAYHDRNWGHFSWGADFSWEWVVILPDSPAESWTLVYMRIGDRNRARTWSQGLIVWHGETPWRTFHGGDLDARLLGLLDVRSPFRVPRIMHLIAPGTACDVPRRLSLTAERDDDSVECTVDLSGLAQIGIPNDTAKGVTMLSETGGKARVRGCIRGSEIDFSGRVLAEFNHAAG